MPGKHCVATRASKRTRLPVFLMTVALCTLDARAEPAYELKIESQPLDAALRELARQSDTQLIYWSRLTKGRRASTVTGSHTVTAALDAMLAGSQLTYRRLNDHTIQVLPLPARQNSRRAASARMSIEQSRDPRPAGDNLIEEVLVTATAEGVVAMRVETPLHEIPQTVSLVTPEQIRAQNLVHVEDALDRVPGLVHSRDNSLQAVFSSRGYPVTSYHVDGSANTFSYRLPDRRLPDLAQFERIEVLRGADGLFSGNGQPGASINLIRKRPGYDPALRLTAWAGSWDNYRVEIDATGPLALDDALRGRMVAFFHDQNSFLDGVSSQNKMLFGVLDYDASPSTLLTLGASYHWSDHVPVLQGVTSVRSDGSLPTAPRNLAMTTDWSFDRHKSLEAYLQLQQELGEQWRLKLGTTVWDTENEHAHATILFGRNPDTRLLEITGAAGDFTVRPRDLKQLTADFTLTGEFGLFGLPTELALGADYGRYHFADTTANALVTGPTESLNDFRTSLYADPRLTSPLSHFRNEGTAESLGAFVAAKIHVTDPLSISVGARAGTERHRVSTRAISSYRAREVPWSSVVVAPYGAVMYELSNTYSLYASYADIYRNPETDLFTLDFSNDPPGGPRRRPDGSRIGVRHGVNMEAGIKAAWLAGSINAALVGYRIEQYRFPLSLAAVGLSGSSTVGMSKSTGADLEFSGKLGDWLFGTGYTFNENHNATGVWNGVRGPRYLVSNLSRDTPKHLLKAWVDKQLTGRLSRWTIGGNLYAQTEQIDLRSVCAGSSRCSVFTNTAFEYNPYALLDLRASFQIDPNWRVGLAVNNVFDKKYYESTGISTTGYWVGEPRNYLLKVEGAFGADRAD